MTALTRFIEINNRRDKVFDFIADATNLPRWFASVAHVEQTDGAQHTRWHWREATSGGFDGNHKSLPNLALTADASLASVEMTTSQHQPPTHIAWRAQHEAFEMSVHAHETQNETTLLEVALQDEAQNGTLSAMTARVLGATNIIAAGTELERLLSNAKRNLESVLTHPATSDAASFTTLPDASFSTSNPALINTSEVAGKAAMDIADDDAAGVAPSINPLSPRTPEELMRHYEAARLEQMSRLTSAGAGGELAHLDAPASSAQTASSPSFAAALTSAAARDMNAHGIAESPFANPATPQTTPFEAQITNQKLTLEPTSPTAFADDATLQIPARPAALRNQAAPVEAGNVFVDKSTLLDTDEFRAVETVEIQPLNLPTTEFRVTQQEPPVDDATHDPHPAAKPTTVSDASRYATGDEADFDPDATIQIQHPRFARRAENNQSALRTSASTPHVAEETRLLPDLPPAPRADSFATQHALREVVATSSGERVTAPPRVAAAYTAPAAPRAARSWLPLALLALTSLALIFGLAWWYSSSTSNAARESSEAQNNVPSTTDGNAGRDTASGGNATTSNTGNALGANSTESNSSALVGDTAPPPMVMSPRGAPRGSSSSATARAEEEALVTSLNRWVSITNRGEASQFINFYAPRVERFYQQRGLSVRRVLSEKQKLAARSRLTDVRITNLKIDYAPDDDMATMTFRKDYKMQTNNRVTEGAVLQELVWRKLDNDWRIISERDIRVLK